MMAADLPSDPTLDEVRAALAPLVARNAAFDGWSGAAVEMAAQQAGVAPEIAALAFDGGPVAMIDAWFAQIDTAMLETYSAKKLSAMKVRERITALVEARLALLARDREALRRALAILAMPVNVSRAAKLGWRAADIMWRAAGDTAVDYNHYSKRALLAGIYSATLLVFLDDESEDHGETRAFLARRIGNVMQFEKAKARFEKRADRRPSLARFVGRLRYHAR
ncbi:MAG: COQ9 family protein [Sphingobium sp.]